MIKKKSFLCIVILGFFWCNFAQSEDCSLIDHDKYQDDFIQCIKKEKKLYETTMEKNSHDLKKFECLNLCKLTVKGGFTINELNTFCLIQCGLK